MKKVYNVTTTALCIAVCFLSFLSCDGTVGKYVYVDILDCCHIDRNCKVLALGEIQAGTLKASHMVRFINTVNFTYGYKYCSQCIDDDSYETLQNIAEINKNNKQ